MNRMFLVVGLIIVLLAMGLINYVTYLLHESVVNRELEIINRLEIQNAVLQREVNHLTEENKTLIRTSEAVLKTNEHMIQQARPCVQLAPVIAHKLDALK